MTQVTAGGRAVEQAEKEDLRVQIEAAANQRFPGAVRAVMVLEYGDEQHVKPGRIMIRVVISPAGPDGQERPLLAFMQRTVRRWGSSGVTWNSGSPGPTESSSPWPPGQTRRTHG
jgi:hypothetical protein